LTFGLLYRNASPLVFGHFDTSIAQPLMIGYRAVHRQEVPAPASVASALN
jgi:hypothetical protein